MRHEVPKNRYPVIILEWNEYAEFMVIEPSDWNGYEESQYTQWSRSRQP